MANIVSLETRETVTLEPIDLADPRLLSFLARDFPASLEGVTIDFSILK